jgi:hypothetical protein
MIRRRQCFRIAAVMGIILLFVAFTEAMPPVRAAQSMTTTYLCAASVLFLVLGLTLRK